MSTTTVEPEVPAVDPVVTAPDPGDYEARVRSDPEFALAELKKQTTNANKFAHELKTLNPLKDVASRLEGGAVTAAQLVYEHAALLQHPDVRAVAEHYRRHGALPTSKMAGNNASESSDDEYRDPIDVLRSELGELKSMLQTVSGRVQQDRTALAQTTMQSHMQQLKGKYSHLWDLIEPFLLEKTEEWERTSQGRDTLLTATFDTWDNLAKIAMGQNIDAVTARVVEQRAKSKQALGTEPGSRTVTTGREEPIREPVKWRPGQAREIIQDRWKREGRPA